MVSTDAQLVSLISQGDRSAFAELYERHAPRVLGLLVRLLPTRGDADDVLQEVFWQVWKTADRYDSTRGSLRVWLFLIARSRAMDMLRRRRPPEVQDDVEPTTWSPPSSSMEQSETRTQVQSALDELSSEFREPITLAYYEGLAHKEISERLQIPLGTAKTRIRAGMKRLRSLLSESASSGVFHSVEVSS